MGRKNKSYWTTLGVKPNGFSSVKGQPLTYTHLVNIYIEDTNNFSKKIYIDSIFIKIKVIGNNYGIELDNNFIKNEIEKEVGTSYFKYDDGLFKRDGGLFPYITYIKLSSVEDYRNFRKIKNRKEKLNKIINKLK